jgi:hypothetical protein
MEGQPVSTAGIVFPIADKKYNPFMYNRLMMAHAEHWCGGYIVLYVERD